MLERRMDEWMVTKRKKEKEKERKKGGDNDRKRNGCRKDG